MAKKIEDFFEVTLLFSGHGGCDLQNVTLMP